MDKIIAKRASLQKNIFYFYLTCFTICTLVVTGCSSSLKSNLPYTLQQPVTPPVITVVWVGYGESFRYVKGVWERTPEQDYEFSVIQRRYNDKWESIKQMHRRHPDYDGAGGPRDISYHFRFNWELVNAGKVNIHLETSLGNGVGVTDEEFRQFKFEISARDVSSFAPFNTYRIVQNYRYETGELIETVELLKKGVDGTEYPFVRIKEKATIFVQKKLVGPPTKIK